MCSKKSSLAGFISLVMVCFFHSMSPAAPPILNYQGTLMDDQGRPVTGSVPMVFRIYATLDATPAQALWSSGTVNVAVVSGAFALDLGDNSTSPPQPILDSSIFSDDTRYLGITVNGQELVPRKRLASVPYAMTAGVPKGLISMWSGSADSIPKGWALCDGNNGTPDLRDRFVVGAGSLYAKGAAGGTVVKDLSHTHVTRDHTLTIEEMPSHTHIQDAHSHATNMSNEDGGGASYQGRTGTGSIDLWLGTTSATPTNQNTGGGSAHNHGSTELSGSSSQDILPPYYALCFIMKL
jgi:hypothetical protein